VGSDKAYEMQNGALGPHCYGIVHATRSKDSETLVDWILNIMSRGLDVIVQPHVHEHVVYLHERGRLRVILHFVIR
jgi:hypothetical protein